MSVDTLLKNFEIFAEAPGGIDRLRELILGLAVSGEISNSDLSSWRTTTLGEEVQIVRGITFPASAKGRNPGKGLLPCLRTANIQNEVDWVDLLYVSEEYVRNDDQYVQKYDLLISMANSRELVGKVALVGRNDITCTLGGFIAAIRCGSGIDPKYLKAILRVPAAREKLIDSSTQTTNIANISLGRLRPFVLNLPPLAEQQDIVTKVDKLMALCDQLEQQQKHGDNLRTATRKSTIDAISTATTPEELETAWKRINNNWEAIADTPESVESLRELILDLAVRGDLGITDISAAKAPTLWDVDEQKLDADKLWKLDTMHVNPANGWSRLPLARLGTWGSGGTPTASRKEFYNNGSIPWAVIGDLNNGIMTSTSSKITQKALASSSAKLIPKNAVLIAMYGASIGKTSVTGIECTTNQAIAHCIVDESVVSTEYFFLVAKSLKKHLIKVGKGAAQPNISQTILKHLLIDVPQLNAQQSVVAKVNEFMALCDQLEAELKSRSEVAEKFTRSVVSATV